MSSSAGPDPYSLSRPKILEDLRDIEWFGECMNRFYRRTARQWNCVVEPSARRLLDACDFWMEDESRTLAFGIDQSETADDADAKPTELDHFKHASILAFWLRRLVPINTTWPADADGRVINDDDYVPTERQNHFLLYGNEWCALLAGFQIALNYELQRASAEAGKDGVPSDFERLLALREVALPDRFIYEFPRLLKHKNISPHAIYMTYRSLFDRFGWERHAA